MEEIKSAAEFQKNVLESTLPAIVDFSATWCGPCRNMAPIVEEFAKEQAGKLNVFKLDIEAVPEIPEQFGVQAVPTFIIFQGGKSLGEESGAMNKKAFTKWVKQFVNL